MTLMSARGRRITGGAGRWLRGATLPAALLLGAFSPAQDGGVTVEDIVNAEHYVNPQINVEIAGPITRLDNFIYSPNGRRALYLVRKGDLSTDSVRFGLHLVTLDKPGKAGFSDRELTAFSSASNQPGISQIRWLDDQTIMLAGASGARPAQLYTLGIDGRLTQLTDSAAEKSGFDIGAHGRTLYGEIVPEKLAKDQKARGYVLGKGTLSGIIRPNGGLWQRSVEYVLAEQKQVRRLKSVSVPFSAFNPFISISPSGRYAVVATAPKFTPQSWVDLPLGPPRLGPLLKAGEPVIPYFLGLALVDLDQDITYPMTGAPMATPDNPNQVIWDEPHGSVILVDQWVTEASGRTIPGLTDFRKPVTFEYSLEQHRPVALIDILPHSGYSDVRANIATGLQLDPRGDKLAIARHDGTRRYQWKDGRWTKTSAAASCARCRAPLFTLRIDQNLDRPPRMTATEAASKITRPIGPILNEELLPRLAPGRLYRWTDRAGRAWQANLILPRGGHDGKALPLVIEPHSFSPDEFIFTGDLGTTAAYAAQSLANSGFAVLVIGDQSPDQSGTREESAIATEGFRSVVASLAGEGVIDRNRVGVIAWSRSGFWLQHALAFEPGLFAAAIAADASSYGQFAYLYFHNWGDHQRDYLTNADKAKPFGDGIDTWRRRDPVTHGGAFNVPLLIEDYGVDVPLWWETYAAMQEEGKPVEMFEMPEAEHDPIRPMQQAILQHATVDWFRFWLKGERTDNPMDDKQYDRWSALCRSYVDANRRGSSDRPAIRTYCQDALEPRRAARE